MMLLKSMLRLVPASIRLGFVALVFVSSTRAHAGDIQFNRDIRPILSSTCFACHGPDSQARKADLRLDIRENALATNAIVPGKPEESSLVQRLLTTDVDQVMPPPSSHKVLTPEQKQKLIDWVKSGAEYQPHWALIAPAMPDLPEVRNKAWVKTPIDRFILAKLEAIGLEPAPEADIRTLVRRVCLDLTGLPPSCEEVDEVAMDPSENRYEKYVDRLLAREQWGEHRGRFWLDYARYADTHGIHFDNFREMWAYRDWVIDAFNQNMPFDQFTIEQLAGDLLPNPTMDQRIATGFHRCNITTNEGGIIDEEYRVLYTRDRTETTAQVWMGLTANCAVCHDHKFDPLTMHDFYSMSAFFNNTTQDARDGNRKDTPPIINVPKKEDRPRYNQLAGEIEGARKAVEEAKAAARPGFDQWMASGEAQKELVWHRPFPEQPVVHFPLHAPESSFVDVVMENTAKSVPFEGKSKTKAGYVADLAWVNQEKVAPAFPTVGDWEKDQPFTLSFWMQRPKKNMSGAIIARMDEAKAFQGWDVWMENDRIGMHMIHAWPDNAVKFMSARPLPADKWTHVAITYDGSAKVAGFKIYFDGEAVGQDTKSDNLTGSIKTTTPFRIGQRSAGSPTPNVAIQDLQFYAVSLPVEKIRVAKTQSRAAYLASKGSKDPKDADKDKEELLAWYLEAKDAAYRERTTLLANLENEKKAIETRGTIAHVMQEKAEPAKAFVLFRGEYDKRRDEVTPNTPKVLPPFAADAPRNRLGLAQWLLAPEHPLTTRVTVNRFWQEIFGTGIVASAGDFGVTGQLPSHPELLDYMAVSFRQDGWNIKSLFRQMVTSAAYRQSSAVTPQKLTADPENRFLSRGTRYRLDAETIRDSALFWSGLLSKRIGGPSVRPYQPGGVWEAVAMPESNTRLYKQDEGDNLYRRSMYTFWKRAAPPASMEILNAPNRETCTVRRERTNTPIQALVTLNDPQFVEAARVLAQRILVEGGENTNDHARIQKLACIVLSRPFIPEELGIVQANLQDLRKLYADKPEAAKLLVTYGASPVDAKLDPSELASWTMLINQVMNLDEALNK